MHTQQSTDVIFPFWQSFLQWHPERSNGLSPRLLILLWNGKRPRRWWWWGGFLCKHSGSTSTSTSSSFSCQITARTNVCNFYTTLKWVDPFSISPASCALFRFYFPIDWSANSFAIVTHHPVPTQPPSTYIQSIQFPFEVFAPGIQPFVFNSVKSVHSPPTGSWIPATYYTDIQG